MRRITVFALAIVLMSMSLSFAEQTPAPMSAVQAVDVGNKHCPVSGREVGVMGSAFKYTYNGKVYSLCCPMCKTSFKNDPNKYSKIAESEAK